MTDSEVAKSGTRSLRAVRRASKRETQKMAAIGDFDRLTNEEKIQHNATLSVLGAVAHFTKPAQVKILEQAVETARERLSVADTVDTIRLAIQGKK
jgi:hypothetical protein